jgi:hypothetical protein
MKKLTKTKKKKKRVHRDLRPQTANLPEQKEVSYRNELFADKVIPTLKFRDLQKECILRGMKPEAVVKSDVHKLHSYFVDNFERPCDQNLLVEFDMWQENELRARGYKDGDAMLRPSLRFSYVKDIDKLPNVQVGEQKEKPKPVKKEAAPPKEKRVKDEKTGVMKGTKKSIVYNMVMEGVTSLKKITKAVMAAYPDANEKSISIWMKKAIKQKNE